MAINEETVKQVAKLAKLEIKEEDIQTFTTEMDSIIDMVEQLEELDTEGVEGTYHGISHHNVWREDKAEEGTDKEALFKNVKTRKDGYIEVPAMFDNGGSEA
ncbi:Asp-tRNA(Asn)/Glu-tRNA(Gln) amidotransferase subunit GatC [Alkalibacterium olivapovliticus]|uniref:Aspartyl/glutamyl-tRNA(Asn/Gln) amidotransferase subunit C n=1 Tax=Alkalibacterium olivapovliticus TaxID=99907 RepID=A0A2T0W864_9LACT|nr:Asp-tRNA(Asn)/Glu-tRNA(Gln) amidotransferase subunit GatC [Alkalibacterium olivapovliticus]PRY82885.1 aspartyl-tRNA(Asn)/glutamyl-tRNA(Gln) amidotransferase subunit C [Alkalibacterium olivapovliticus]